MSDTGAKPDQQPAFDEDSFAAYIAEHRAETARLNVYGRLVASLLAVRGDSRFGTVLSADQGDAVDAALGSALSEVCGAIAAIARLDQGKVPER